MTGRKIFLTLALAMSGIISSYAQGKIDLGPKSPIRKLQIAEFAINALYVDSLDENKLVENAINGMLKNLDPHSSYSSAQEVKKLTEPLEGSFEGIGIQFNMADDTLLVIQPVSGGPSEKKGILAGDRIVKVNDTIVAGVKMNRDEIVRRLRGPKGSKVKLGIVRRGIAGIQDFTVVRDKIPVNSVDASYMVDKSTGYIRLNNFGATTHDEFTKKIKELREKGMKSLILDLQGNGGGYLSAAVDIANEFLNKDDMIVYTSGRSTKRQDFTAKGNGIYTSGKVLVLVDEYSASAAEILTGAIQDHDRGLVIGRRTFGKGLVQRPISLPDGSMIRLTVSHYYTPSGRCIQKPYKMGDKLSYDMDVINRYKNGELTNADSIHFADSLKFKTLRLGRTVYGGGGIMPDIFVALDTTRFTKLYKELAVKGCIINTNLKYVDKHRKKLMKTYSSFDEFNSSFEVPEDMIDILKDYAEKEKIEYTDSALNEAMPMVKLQLKALVARDLWDMNEYYHVINVSNPIYTKAVEVIKDDKYFKEISE